MLSPFDSVSAIGLGGASGVLTPKCECCLGMEVFCFGPRGVCPGSEFVLDRPGRFATG